MNLYIGSRWMPLTLTAVLTVLGQLNNIFFKNNQKKSGLHKSHSVIERQGVREETEYLFFRLIACNYLI